MTGLIHVLTRLQAEICDRLNPYADKEIGRICDMINPCADKGTGRNM